MENQADLCWGIVRGRLCDAFSVWSKNSRSSSWWNRYRCSVLWTLKSRSWDRGFSHKPDKPQWTILVGRQPAEWIGTWDKPKMWLSLVFMCSFDEFVGFPPQPHQGNLRRPYLGARPSQPKPPSGRNVHGYEPYRLEKKPSTNVAVPNPYLVIPQMYY